MLLKSLELFRGVYVYQVCAFDRQQAEELFREEFKEDPDINKLRITRINSTPIMNNERIYSIFFRLDEKYIDRPSCEECGSNHVISRGKEWYCRNCGKYWSKIRRNRNT